MDTRTQLVLDALSSAYATYTGWLRAMCPFCAGITGKADRRRSLGLHEESGYWHCFKCQEKGRLKDYNPTILPVRGPEISEEQDIDLGPPEDFCTLFDEPGSSAMFLQEPRAMLRRRGIPVETWGMTGIGASLRGVAAYRVVIPITEKGEWKGWVGRTWIDAQPRYLYAKGMRRQLLFWNSDVITDQTDEPLILVEGCFDALPYYPDGVACLGKPTRDQAGKLRKAQRPIAVCLDGDAWREGEALAMKLKFWGLRAGFVQLPPKEDPNSVPPEWLRTEARICIGE